jgi:LuxR family transcriptional regulator, maltose regulon positive regulatory protein
VTAVQRVSTPERELRQTRAWDRLDLLADASLAAVIAPAGAGKSTAVRSWLRSRGFDHVLIEIVAPRDIRTAIDVLSRPGGDMVVIDAQTPLPRAHELNLAIRTALGSGRRIVVVGRELPPVGFWRMLGRGDAVLIGFSDLALTREQVTELVRRAAPETPDSEIDFVHDLTRGWPALIALLLDVRMVPETARSMHVLDAQEYLEAEVVDGLDDRERRTLCELAHLDTFTIDMVMALDLIESSRDLAHVRTMLLPVEGSTEQEYSLVPMLGELLRRTSRAVSAGDLTELHRAASRWYESRGQWNQALAHMLQVNPSRAVRQFTRMLAALEPAGRTDEGLAWLRDLPPQIRTQPAALLGLALALVHSRRPHEAKQIVDQIDVSGWILDQVCEYEMIAAMVNRMLSRHEESVAHAQRALHMLGNATGISPARRSYLRVMTIEQLRESYLWDGDLVAVRSLMDDIDADLIRSERVLSLVHSTAVSALAALDGGDLATASEKAETTLVIARQHHFIGTHIVAEAHLARGLVALEQDDVDTGLTELLRARELARRSIFPTTVLRIDLALATGFARAGQMEQAWQVLDDLGAIGRRSGPPGLDARILVAAVDVHLVAGQRKQARALYQRLAGMPGCPATEHARIRLAVRLGAHHDAMKYATARGDAHQPLAAVARHLSTAAGLRSVDPQAASEHCTIGLRSAEQLGLWRTVVDLLDGHGALVAATLIHADLVDGPTPRFVRSLVAVINDSGGQESPLSDREAQVAALLPTRMTNPRIASELFISENTVKTHVRHIYQKLGVDNRDDAVVELLARGLVDESDPATR